MDLFVKKEKDSFKFDFDKILKDFHEDLTNISINIMTGNINKKQAETVKRIIHYREMSL